MQKISHVSFNTATHKLNRFILFSLHFLTFSTKMFEIRIRIRIYINQFILSNIVIFTLNTTTVTVFSTHCKFQSHCQWAAIWLLGLVGWLIWFGLMCKFGSNSLVTIWSWIVDFVHLLFSVFFQFVEFWQWFPVRMSLE